MGWRGATGECDWCGKHLRGGSNGKGGSFSVRKGHGDFCSNSCSGSALNAKNAARSNSSSESSPNKSIGIVVVIIIIVAVAAGSGGGGSSSSGSSVETQETARPSSNQQSPSGQTTMRQENTNYQQSAPSRTNASYSQPSRSTSTNSNSQPTYSSPSRSTNTQSNTGKGVLDSDIQAEESAEYNILGGGYEAREKQEVEVKNLFSKGYSVHEIHKKTGYSKSFIRNIKKSM